MKNRILVLFSFIVVLVFCFSLPVFAADTWDYYFSFSVSDNTGVDRTYLPILTGISGQSLIDSHYLNSSGNETDMKEGSTTKDYGVSTGNVSLVIPSLIGGQTRTYRFYTGYNLATSQSIIPGYGGYFTIPDASVLDLSNNGSIILTDFSFSMTSTKETKFNRCNSISLYTIDSTKIVADVAVSTNALDFEQSNGDSVAVNDADAFTFSSGGGIDLPFSIVGWIKPESSINSPFFIKGTSASSEWSFNNYNNQPLMTLYNGANYIGQMATTTLNNGTWYHIGMSYSGSKTAAGIKLYIDGVSAPSSPLINGSYAGMTNTATSLYLGSYPGVGNYDGVLSNLKLYNTELTPSEMMNDYLGVHKATNLVAWYKLIDGSGNPIDSSGNDYNAVSNTADWITTGGQCKVSAVVSGISSGEKDITILLDSNNLTLFVDSQNSTVSLGGISVPDSGSDYVLENFSYIGSLKYYVGGNLIAWYEPTSIISGTTLPDRQGADNNATITWGSNPSGITVTLLGMTSYETTTKTGADSAVIGSNAVQEYEEPSDWFVTGTFSGVLTPELKEVFTTKATELGMPTRSLYLMIMFGVAVAIGLSILLYTGSVLIAIIGISAVLIAGSSAQVIDYALALTAIVLMIGSYYLLKQH